MITIDLPPHEIAKLQKAMDKAAEASSKGMDGIIRRVSILAAQSAAKATPTSKKRKSKKIANWSRKKKEKEGAPFWAEYRIEWWKENTMNFSYAKDQVSMQKLKIPKYKNAAKRGWWEGIRRWGKRPPAGVAKSARTGRVAGTLREFKTAGRLTGVQIANRISYISKIAPESAEVGIRNATQRFIKTEQKRLAKEIERGFNR